MVKVGASREAEGGNAAAAGDTSVVFDSVAVPHQVLATEAGERWAMAGWLHEPSQGVPAWLG